MTADKRFSTPTTRPRNSIPKDSSNSSTATPSASSSGGGGGYGDPLERDPEAVREDVVKEYITVEEAHDVYGVVFHDDEDGLRVDEAATESRRSELAA
ncbi:hypothetical protein D8S78_23475 [Natrialba swarupiae]|nr:hypothetical protein [Natrialba swarupiae]